MIRTICIVIALFFTSVNVCSQQYYALLISGSGPNQSTLAKSGTDLTEEDMDALACWHGIYTMWKTLTQEQGYLTSHVIVLYKNGSEYESENDNYSGGITVNGPATYQAVHNALTVTLKNQVTSNDVLFIYLGGHGYQASGEAILELVSSEGSPGAVAASEFASWANEIACRKRIAVMAQCMSGAFAPALASGPCPTIAMSCGTGFQFGYRADDDVPDGVDTEENEIVTEFGPPKTYYHWEFDYHVTNAIRNRTFVNEETLGSSLDLDGNGGRSLSEIFAWEQTRETSEFGDPYLWDPRKLAAASYVKCSI